MGKIMQKNVSGKIRRRMVAILICFCVFGFAVLLVRLFMIQIVKGEEYQQHASQQQTRATNLGAKRGTIYDRNGTTLVQSATVWNICISPADIEEEKLEETAKKLGEILEVTPEFIKEQASERQFYYKIIKKRVNAEVREAVLSYITDEANDGANQIKGVFAEPDTKRYYTYGSLASTVLGFTNYDNHGAYGLEAKYDKVLSGTPGVVVSAKNAWGSDMPFKYQQMNEAKDGNSLVLTIDEGIQHFLEKHLDTAMVEHSIGNRAAGIVMNVKTGEILAMATKNDFDPNDPYTLQDPAAVAELEDFKTRLISGALTEEEIAGKITTEEAKLAELQFDQWRNKAISDPYEPGSVFKIITAATAVDNNVVTLNDSFFCNYEMKVASETYHCWQKMGHGAQNFTQAMQNSCNPAFITIGQRVGARLMFSYMDNFGFGKPTGIDLPGEADGILHSFDVLNKEGMVELSSTSFGQTFKATPLQMITAVSAAVNGGNLMQPYIVKQIRDDKGNVIQTNNPTVQRQVISAESSEVVRGLVEAVVDGGSGRYAAIPGYRIGGKTGTSEKLDTKGNTTNILSFVGFAPMDDPQYAILVMLDEPKLDNVFGSVIAAPVVGAIYQEMLPYVGLEATLTAEEQDQTEIKVPYLVGYKPHDAQGELTVLGLQTRIVGNGPEVLRQIPLADQKIPKGMTVTLFTDEESIEKTVTVPNVVGMTAQEANKAIVTNAGLNIKLLGVTNDGVQTIVTEQWPLAGETANPGDIVQITLDHKPEESTEVIAEAAAPIGPEAPMP